MNARGSLGATKMCYAHRRLLRKAPKISALRKPNFLAGLI